MYPSPIKLQMVEGCDSSSESETSNMYEELTAVENNSDIPLWTER